MVAASRLHCNTAHTLLEKPKGKQAAVHGRTPLSNQKEPGPRDPAPKRVQTAHPIQNG